MAKTDKQIRGGSAEFNRSTFSFAWILAASVVVLLGLLLFYMRQDPRTTEVRGDAVVAQSRGEAVVAQPPVAPDAEQPAQNTVEQNSQSEAAATQIVAELKRFQDATESGMDYNEYDKKLNSLKANLNTTLPSFVRHNPSDETFRQEVASALQDYTAAGNWWKTTIQNGTVFTETDRDERTQRNWASARTHLTNAENVLVR